MRPFAVMLLFLMTALVAAPRASAAKGDWVSVVHNDGREFFGQVEEETEFKLVLNVRQGSISAKMTFAKRDLRQITAAERPGGAGPATTAEEAAVEEEDAAPATSLGTGGYVIAPLRGVFGEHLNAALVRSFVQRAVDARAEAIIFDLDSPGGLVSELDAIRDVLDEFEDRIRVVFYVKGDAFSAAALLCMSSREFLVGPDARFGAAVSSRTTRDGSREVDAKLNSAFASKWRSRAERVGRPGLIVDAMVVMDVEVYADTTTSPWTLSSLRPGDVQAATELLDSARTVLSLTSRVALATGAADGEAAVAADVVGKLGLENPSRRAFDGEALARTYRASYDRNMQVVRKAVQDFDDALALLRDERNIRKAEKRLREMRGSLQRIIVLYKRHEYVARQLDAAGYDLDSMERILRRINDAIRDL